MPVDTNLLRARRILLAQAIRAARLRRRLTQSDVSSALGVPQSWVSNVEAGARRVDVAELMEIASVLGVSTSALIVAMETTDV
ncbi:helix-turn-helix domain-containing protein [Corynebacterium mastitidis]|uniref:helix-turn-helix domain-containing protein n=1 Tax=Corynebacterium mastitidis TaxID=161890 RepID=UPI003D71BAEE